MGRAGTTHPRPTTETFATNDHGKIDRTTHQTSNSLNDSAEQRDWYANLRRAALTLQAAGPNALGGAASHVKHVVDCLPEDISHAKIAMLWPTAHRIRKLKAAHERALKTGDAYHPNLIDDVIIDDIEQFVDVYNNLVLGDENLSAKDMGTKGPQDPNAHQEISEAGNQAIEAAIENDLFTDPASDILQDLIAEDREIISNDDNSVLEKLAQDNIERSRANGIRAIIVRIRNSKSYGAIKQGALMAIGALVVKYVEVIMPALIKLVLSIFGL